MFGSHPAREFALRNALLFAKTIHIIEEAKHVDGEAVSVVISGATAYIPMEELVDREKEIARLLEESRKMDKEIARASGMLNNPNFTSKAPPAKVEEEKAKLAKYQAVKQQIEEQLARYNQ